MKALSTAVLSFEVVVERNKLSSTRGKMPFLSLVLSFSLRDVVLPPDLSLLRRPLG